jgi:nitroreductase
MEFQQLLTQRRSVRAYAPRAVERDLLEKVLSAATLAPSAGGLQAYRMHVVLEPGLRQGLAAAAHGQDFLAHAPAVLVFCADLDRARDYGVKREGNYSVQDALIAMAYAQLAAADLGLGTCWVGAFDAAVAATVLGLPDTERPVALMPIGYGAEVPEKPARRPLLKLVQWHGVP